jgi:hypothetical protein
MSSEAELSIAAENLSWRRGSLHDGGFAEDGGGDEDSKRDNADLDDSQENTIDEQQDDPEASNDDHEDTEGKKMGNNDDLWLKTPRFVQSECFTRVLVDSLTASHF